MRLAEAIEKERRRRVAAILTLAAGLAALLGAGSASRAATASRQPAAVPGEIVVRFAPGVRAAKRTRVLGRHAVRRAEPLGLARAKLLELSQGTSVGRAIEALDASPAIAYAEPNYIRASRVRPDDPSFGEQWSLRQIGAPQAWRRTKGSRRVTVAVADDGVEIDHPDLAANIWTKPGADDVHGWDFAGGDNDPRPERGDSQGEEDGAIAPHGTHVAGIIGAVGDNGIGIAGINWAARILPLRIFGSQGFTTTARIVEAIGYAGRRGARAFNASFGASTPSNIERDAIAAWPDTLFVVAAPNEPTNLDANPDYPCSYPLENVVCVTASDRSGALPSFAARGRRTADIAAPGVEILSTIPGGYGTLSGTSMAAPHVSGAIALLAAARPKLSASRIRSLLLTTAVRKKVRRAVASGRLNVRRAVAKATKRKAKGKGKSKTKGKRKGKNEAQRP